MSDVRLVIATICILFSNFALAGIWSSGGGELVKDAHNPWFLDNTREVHYCVLIDKENFSVAEDALKEAIQSAFAYWKTEFARGSVIQLNDIRVKVATQSFVETACSPTTDIVFQMGFLSPEQIKWIGDPTKYIGLTLRTNYDPINLRGKGLIYISPESGPLKASDARLVDNPWSLGNHGLLLKVLVHELGHLFGIQHSIPFQPMGHVMSAAYPEFILNKKYAAYVEPLALPGYFAINEHNLTEVQELTCNEKGLAPTSVHNFKFFGIPADAVCTYITYQNGQLNVYAAKVNIARESVPYTDKMELVGRASLPNEEVWDFSFAVELWLPPEQRVFSKDAFPPGLSYFWGPAIKQSEKKGVYKSVDGKVIRKMSVILPTPLGGFGGARILGVWDGELYRYQ